jgi:hypothetical protein
MLHSQGQSKGSATISSPQLSQARLSPVRLFDSIDVVVREELN